MTGRQRLCGAAVNAIAAVVVTAAMPPAPRAQQRCERGDPMTREDVFRLVRAGVPNATVRDVIVACGASFLVDDNDAAALRAAGASSDVLALVAPLAAPATGAIWRAPIDRRDMAWLPPGQFQMGSPAAESGRTPDEAGHTAEIGRGFWIDVDEVTNESYRRFLIANPSWQKGRIESRFHDGNYLKTWTGTEFPAGKGDASVVWVSWHAASAFARWAGKRLPTEAEWEYAARSGTRTRYWWGTAFDASRVAPNAAGAGSAATKSAWNISSMLGGVWEWTSSAYRPYPYRSADGREEAGADPRVKRGGASNSGERFLRAASRS